MVAGSSPPTGARGAGDDDALLTYFAAARPDLDATAELGAALRAALDAARAAWPDLDVTAETFALFVAAKLPAGEPAAAAAVAALHAADLYLACACARGDARALAHFESLCAPVVGWVAARLGASAEQRDDLAQVVRRQLLAPRAPPGGGPSSPRVGDYGGRGALSAWVRVVAMREGVDLLRHSGRERLAEDDELARRLEPDAGPELAYGKRLYRAEFGAAFAEALAALTKGERTLLRQHALDGMSVDRLAAFYGVHRSTAARRVEAVRRLVLEHTRRALARRLRLAPDELESVMRLIQSRLDVTLSPLLFDGPAEPAASDAAEGGDGPTSDGGPEGRAPWGKRARRAP